LIIAYAAIILNPVSLVAIFNEVALPLPGLSIAKNTVFTYNTRPIHPPLVYARLSKHTLIALSLHKSGLTHHKSYGTK